MKRVLPSIINTFCYVTILVLLCITGIYAGCMNNTFPIVFIWYAMANGAASALLTLLFLTDVIIKECAGPLRMVLFLITLYGSVTSLSIVFDIVNPANLPEIIVMCIAIAIIFLVVFFVNRYALTQQEKELTEKLNEFNAALGDDE